MVIEAKTYLARTPEREWLTHPYGPPKERSPFQQAGSAMHRIKEWVRTHGLPDVLSACAVIVPDMDVSAGRDQIEWSARPVGGRVRAGSGETAPAPFGFRSGSGGGVCLESWGARRSARSAAAGAM